MRFFPTLKDSASSTLFYHHLRQFRLRESIAFWLKFYGIALIVMLIPVVVSGFIAKDLLNRYYPANLKITYADGTVHVDGAKLPLSFMLASTKITVTPVEVVFNTPDGQTIADKYADALQGVGSFTLTKEDANNFVPEVLPAIALVVTIALIAFVVVFRLPLILIYALLVRSIMALLGKKITYKEVLQMAFHASVVAEIVNVAVLLIYRNGSFPMFDVAFFGIMILALRSRPAQTWRTG
ncbi:MAG TPA: DUF1189 family protein [Candidatus Saccharimonadia bacterium]|nr:DUF1189 family protein [Candidatus Saccharimonadia bacterium]